MAKKPPPPFTLSDDEAKELGQDLRFWEQNAAIEIDFDENVRSQFEKFAKLYPDLTNISLKDGSTSFRLTEKIYGNMFYLVFEISFREKDKPNNRFQRYVKFFDPLSILNEIVTSEYLKWYHEIMAELLSCDELCKNLSLKDFVKQLRDQKSAVYKEADEELDWDVLQLFPIVLKYYDFVSDLEKRTKKSLGNPANYSSIKKALDLGFVFDREDLLDFLNQCDTEDVRRGLPELDIGHYSCIGFGMMSILMAKKKKNELDRYVEAVYNKFVKYKNEKEG